MAAALYTASEPRLWAPHGLRPFVWAGLLASATQVIGIALHGFGSNVDNLIINGESVGARPINAAASLMILVGLIVLVVDGRPMSAGRLVVTAWLGISIVVSEQRSVWVAAAVSGVFVLASLVRVSRQRLVAGTVAVIAGIALTMGVRAIVRSQPDLEVAASSTSTFDWRIENWTEKLTTPRSDPQWLAGSVAGPTPLNDPDTIVVFSVSSHSMYVETIGALGLLGFSLLLLVILGALKDSVQGGAPRIAVVCALTFGAFYQWPGFIWFVMGIALVPQTAPWIVRRACSEGDMVADRPRYDSRLRDLSGSKRTNLAG